MPEGCIIGLSTAALVVQNISQSRWSSSCMLYWSRVRPRCVMILVSVFLWSWVRPARLTKINASKFSPNGNACLCICLRCSLYCLNATNASSSDHGMITWGSPPGNAAATAAFSAWSRSCWMNRIASGLVITASGSKSIQDSIRLLPVSWNLVIHFWRSTVPLLNFMNCMTRHKNTFWAPLMKWGRRNLLKEFTPSLGSLSISLSNSLLYCRASPSSRLREVGPRFSGSNSVICKSKENSSPIICWSYLCGHLLRIVASCESVSAGVLFSLHKSHIGSIHLHRQCIDNVEVIIIIIIIIAMACHCLGSTWSFPSMRDHSAATTWRGALASTSRSAKASSPMISSPHSWLWRHHGGVF